LVACGARNEPTLLMISIRPVGRRERHSPLHRRAGWPPGTFNEADDQRDRLRL
jgi:hypothetical protein